MVLACAALNHAAPTGDQVGVWVWQLHQHARRFGTTFCMTTSSLMLACIIAPLMFCPGEPSFDARTWAGLRYLRAHGDVTP